MSVVKLGEQFVRFAVHGLKEAEEAVKGTAGKIEGEWAKMRARLAQGLSSVGGGLAKVASGMKSLALMAGAGAGGFMAYFARGAMQGTYEGDALTRSIEILTRTVGSIFAPAVRIATGLILRIARAFNGLSSDTKANIAIWSLVAAGVAAAVASLPVFGSVLTATFTLASGAVTAFLGVLGLIPPLLGTVGTVTSTMVALISGAVGIASTMTFGFLSALMSAVTATAAIVSAAFAAWPLALAASLVFLGASLVFMVAATTGKFDSTIKSAVEGVGGFILDLIQRWKTGGTAIVGDSKTWLGKFVQFTANAVLTAVSYWNILMTHVQKLYDSFKDFYDQLDLISTAITGIGLPGWVNLKPLDLAIDEEKLRQKFANWHKWADGLGESLLDRLGRAGELLGGLPDKARGLLGGVRNFLKGLFDGGGAMKFSMKFDAGFENLQQTWERLQSADFRTQDEMLDAEKKQLGVMEKIEEKFGDFAEKAGEFFRGFKGWAAVGG